MYKIEIAGNFFVLKKSDTNEVHIRQSLGDLTYSVNELDTDPLFTFRGIFTTLKPILSRDNSFSFSDLQKSDGSSFADIDECIQLLNESLGFSRASGSGVSDVDKETLKHFIYNPVTDQLEADRSIVTTLSSLYFGEQHGIHSAGENVVFTNESTGVNWFPAWQGITKTQEYLATTRKYSALNVIAETEGTADSDFRELYPNPNAVSVFGFKIKLGQALSVGDVLRYRVHYYNGSQNDVIGSATFESNLYTQIYEQEIAVDAAYSTGDFFELNFTHPVEVHSGQIIYDEIVINGDGTYLQARESQTPNIFFQEIFTRTFTDILLATQQDIEGLTSGVIYQGTFDDSTGLPTLPLAAQNAQNGDKYEVNVAGSNYAVGDVLIYNSTTDSYDHIPANAVSLDSLDQGSLRVYDWYVKPDYVGVVKTGKVNTPFITLKDAISASSKGDSIFIDGVDVITSSIVLPHSLTIVGTLGSEIKYGSYDVSNGDVFTYNGAYTDEFVFEKLIIKNAGGYGILAKKPLVFEVRRCKFFNNGWDGTNLHTVASAAQTGLFGYDSTQAELQSFYAGPNASDGGAVRIEDCPSPLIRESRAQYNLRGFRLQDCGIGGGGFVIENQAIMNIDSGFYLAVGDNGGCQNIVTTVNYSAFNANNGYLIVGGINNEVSQMKCEGNWSAGVCQWGTANFTVRDSALFNNNRSFYNGIGNEGDAKASVQINDSEDFLEVDFQVNPNRRFLTEILDTQIHYTGIGSNTDKVGIFINENMGELPDSDQNIIKIDDVGFIDQDYAIDLSEVDISNLRLVLGDNSYVNIKESNIRGPLAGMYAELPFSNHITSVKELDIRIDTVAKSVTLVEGLNGKVINVYKKNELQAIDRGTHVDIVQRDSDRIQLRGNLLGNVYINGVTAGSNIPTMTEEINDAVDLTITEYKDFIETEVGVEGAETTTTWYYIEHPSGVYHYPLFKTADEANAVDSEQGGSGTSHTHTYASDLSNTTWYMPDSNNHMDSSDIPLNGLFGTIPNVIWNIWNTDTSDPVNPAPVFGDASYNILEGNYVNIAYRNSNDSDSYAITNTPSWVTDDGNALTGYAPNNISENITLNIYVTRSNGNGSDSGTITLNVYNDAGNDSTSETTFDSAISFTGSNKYAYQTATGNNYNPLRMGGQSFSSSIDEGTSDPSTHTSSNNSSRPWQVGIVFKHDGSSTNQTLWGQCEGSSSNHDNIMVTIDASKNCYFQWGKESDGYNKKFLGNIPAHTWVGLSVVHKGQRWRSGDATTFNLNKTFQFNWVDLATGNVQNYVYGYVTSQINNTDWSTTGKHMTNQIQGTFVTGGRANNRSFKGDIASLVVTSLKIGDTLPTDAEISMLIRDPKKWLTDYKVGNTYRTGNSWTQSSTFYLNSNGPAWATKVWLMGDGTNDSYNNMIRNQVYPADQNYTMLRLNNMQSSDIVSASIAGITANANIINVNANNYSFSNGDYDGYIINITSSTNWTVALPQLSTLPNGYEIKFRNLSSASYVGNLVPYSTETIDGVNANKVVDGKVQITLQKENNTNWIVSEIIQFEEYLAEEVIDGSQATINVEYSGGNVSNVYDFTATDVVVLNHNFGGIPLIQVWIEDGAGGYTDLNVDIDHDWVDMLSSTINLGSVESGKLVYSFNS